MEPTQNPLEKYKHSLNQQGFISPMLTTLAPHEKLKRHSSNQEICGVVLDGELKLVTDLQNTTYTKHEIFFIDGSDTFEIQK
jgi:quercetin dioxygenase-like cupin family protein